MRRTIAVLLTLALVPVAIALRAQQRPAPEPNRWEPAMQKFEEQHGYKSWTRLVRPHLN